MLVAGALIVPFGILVLPLALARYIFFVPAITIEDRHVLASFRRSEQLTRGRTGQMLGRLLASAVVVFLVVAMAGLVGTGLSIGIAEAIGGELSLIGTPTPSPSASRWRASPSAWR